MKARKACRSGPCAAQAGIALAVMLAVAGCAGPAAAPETVSAYSGAAVTVSTQYALLKDAVVLGPVEGVSCARSPFAAKATKGEATSRLKHNAARMGATGVVHMRVATRGIGPSCWYGFVARGIAYR